MTYIDYEKLTKYMEFFSERVLKANQYLDSKFPNQTTYNFESGIDFHAGFIHVSDMIISPQAASFACP
jgi:hypothetical protein